MNHLHGVLWWIWFSSGDVYLCQEPCFICEVNGSCLLPSSQHSLPRNWINLKEKLAKRLHVKIIDNLKLKWSVLRKQQGCHLRTSMFRMSSEHISISIYHDKHLSLMFSVCLQAAKAANKLSSEQRGRKHTKHVSHHSQGGGYIAMLVVPQSWVFWECSCSSAKHVRHQHKLACTMQDSYCAQQNVLTGRRVHFKVFDLKSLQTNCKAEPFNSGNHFVPQEYMRYDLRWFQQHWKGWTIMKCDNQKSFLSQVRHCCMTTGVGAINRSMMPKSSGEPPITEVVPWCCFWCQVQQYLFYESVLYIIIFIIINDWHIIPIHFRHNFLSSAVPASIGWSHGQDCWKAARLAQDCCKFSWCFSRITTWSHHRWKFHAG